MAAERALDRALARGAAALGVPLPPRRRRLLLDFLELLVRWNRSYNLTAVRDPVQMVPRHLLDSLTVAPLVRGTRVLDVGSGAGFPGLVLAVALPEVSVTLLDASLKRTRFLDHAALSLDLHNVTVARERLERFAAGRQFDTVTSRASLPLAELLPAAAPLLAPGGRLLAMQGRMPTPRPEPPPGYRLRIHVQRVPGLEAERHVVEMVAAG